MLIMIGTIFMFFVVTFAIKFIADVFFGRNL